MKKVLLVLGVFVVSVLLVGSIVWKQFGVRFTGALPMMTIIGIPSEITFRLSEAKLYQATIDTRTVIPSYSWIKTRNSEAVILIDGFGTIFLDKNTTIQLQVEPEGVYGIQLAGNSFHAVEKLAPEKHYNILADKRVFAVKGTGFGIEGDGSGWVNEGDVVVIDEVVQDNSTLSEEDVPDGPLIRTGDRTVIVGNPARRWMTIQEMLNTPGSGNGNNYGPGSDIPAVGGGQRPPTQPITGSSWRERARELYRRWRELEARRRGLSDREYADELLRLLNAYAGTVPTNPVNTTDMPDCGAIRASLDSALFAIDQLRLDTQKEEVANEIFAEQGGLDGMEYFITHVCEDNRIDEQEKRVVESLQSMFGPE